MRRIFLCVLTVGCFLGTNLVYSENISSSTLAFRRIQSKDFSVISDLSFEESDRVNPQQSDFPPKNYYLKDVRASKNIKPVKTVLIIASGGIGRKDDPTSTQNLNLEPGINFTDVGGPEDTYEFEFVNGTLLASVAGGIGKKSATRGVVRGITIVPVKITTGNEPIERVAPNFNQTLEYALHYKDKHNVNVVVMADLVTSRVDLIDTDAIARCNEAGIPIVLPAGDRRVHLGHYLFGNLASYRSNNIVAVGSSMHPKVIAADTNIGEGIVRVTAPSFLIKFGLFYYNSSSIGAAITAAALAQVMDKAPDMHTAIARIQKTVFKVGDVMYVGGILDIKSALKSKLPADLIPTNFDQIPASGISGQRFTIIGGGEDAEGQPLNRRVYVVYQNEVYVASDDQKDSTFTFPFPPGVYPMATVRNDGFHDSAFVEQAVTITDR